MSIDIPMSIDGGAYEARASSEFWSRRHAMERASSDFGDRKAKFCGKNIFCIIILDLLFRL